MTLGEIEIRYVSKRGGSLTLNIPVEIAKRMGLEAGCPVVMLYDRNLNRILIEKVQSIHTDGGRDIELTPNGCT